MLNLFKHNRFQPLCLLIFLIFLFTACKKHNINPILGKGNRATQDDVAKRKIAMKNMDLSDYKTYFTDKNSNFEYAQNKGLYQNWEYIKSVRINSNAVLESGNNGGYIKHSMIQGIKTRKFFSITLEPGYTGLEWDENWVVWINGVEVLRTHGYGELSQNINIPESIQNDNVWNVRVSMEWLGYPKLNSDVYFGEIEDLKMGHLFTSSGNNQITIQNNTNSSAYVLIYGYNGNNVNSNYVCFYNFSSGLVENCTTDNYNLSAQMKEIPAGSPLTIATIPFIWSGRILISYGSIPADPFIVRHNNSLHNGYEIVEPGMKDNVLYDKFELTYTPDGMWCNTTIVDFYGIQTQTTMSAGGQTDQETTDIIQVGNSTRTNFFNSFRSAPVPFNNAIYTVGGKDLRVFSPLKMIDLGYMQDSYFEPYISHCWQYYSQTQNQPVMLLHTPNFGDYEGRVVNNQIIFQPVSGQTTGNVVINKPVSSRDIFGCTGSLTAPNNTPLGEIAAAVGAAMNRSVFHLPCNQWLDKNLHYKTGESQPWFRTNIYAKIIHEYANGNPIYAFPFDDVVAPQDKGPLMHMTGSPNIAINLKNYN